MYVNHDGGAFNGKQNCTTYIQMNQGHTVIFNVLNFDHAYQQRVDDLVHMFNEHRLQLQPYPLCHPIKHIIIEVKPGKIVAKFD